MTSLKYLLAICYLSNSNYHDRPTYMVKIKVQFVEHFRCILSDLGFSLNNMYQFF